MQAYCTLCRSPSDRVFYLCFKTHILCPTCCEINNKHLCNICDSNLVRCAIVDESLNSVYEYLISRKLYEFGPVILFNNDFLSQNLVRNPECTESANTPVRYRLIRCVNCCKCLSSTRIREHYTHEHRNLLICPLPMGGILSFTLKYDNVSLLELKNIQNFSIDGEQSEKIYSIMATKVPHMLPSYHKSYHIIIIWLYSVSHACHVTYTIQAVTGRKDLPLASFTGQPMDSNFMDKIVKGKSTLEEFGQYLIIKKSFFDSSEFWPGTIINVSVHNS